MKRFERIFCIVLDGVGVGAAPDAGAYGDAGSNSVANTARAVGGLRIPNLERMGFGNVCSISGVRTVAGATGHHGRMRPRSAGKDSTSGHWELMGYILDTPMPVYPDGFPLHIIERFSGAVGRRVLGNKAASGTQILEELGERHIETGALIVYTSQDSVFQIAAHESVVPVDELYEYCRIARGILVPPHGVGRVIARPFLGSPGGFHRTERRRDFSIEPPGETVLDGLVAAGRRVVTVGKVDDLFAGRGISRAEHTGNNREGMKQTLAAARGEKHADADLVFTNLIDFDTMWGHRNDARAYALGLEDFDSFLSEFLPSLGEGDLLVITSDHGNDPTTQGTDHSREEVPLLVWHGGIANGTSLGVRETFADAGATIADNFGLGWDTGTSFLADI